MTIPLHANWRKSLGVRAEVELVGSITARPETRWEHVRLYRAEHEGPFILEASRNRNGGLF